MRNFIMFSLFCISGSGSGSNTNNDVLNNKHVKMECLATDEDYRAYHCFVSPEESIRVPCVDENEGCPDWAVGGECSSNQQFMLLDCRKSCKSCIDLHGHAGSDGVLQIASSEGTRQNVLKRLYETQEYLHHEAKRNIITMKRCVNKHAECTHWWSIGECDVNPGFMHTECSPACQTCQKIV
mmetsp:Transcript_62643/g.70039  ORF Transcript_62643/g.70039 Transcript_62643/m.70039 type:complete len:182 (-) Transcript_62643:102-647(-)